MRGEAHRDRLTVSGGHADRSDEVRYRQSQKHKGGRKPNRLDRRTAKSRRACQECRKTVSECRILVSRGRHSNGRDTGLITEGDPGPPKEGGDFCTAFERASSGLLAIAWF
jgi:hypothetical protein